jgi:heme-degrading monooxygenase HmoA
MLRRAMKKTTLLAALLIVAASCAMTQSNHPPAKPRVARMWRGEVPAARADEYEKYLHEAGVQKLRAIPKNLGVQMFRRPLGDREEFVVISYWPDEDAIRAYAGENVTEVHALPRDPEFLVDPDTHVRHYTIKVDRE